MNKILVAFLVFLCPVVSSAATWYVRTDGGSYGTTSTTCNGQTDAAFTGANGPNCAVNHPFEILGTQAGTPRVQRIAGGDTVIIKNGSYRMGATPGLYESGSCHTAWSYDCYTFPIPSGPNPSNKTKIYGEGYASCSTKPELWGAGATRRVLNLDGSSNVDLRCLDITDHDDCGGNDSNFSCPTYSSTVLWAGAGLYYYSGSNNELTDVDIHGFASGGIYAGKQTAFAVTRVNIRGNALVGFDQDTANADDSWSGTNTFDEMRVMWAGCSENYPVDGGYIGCTDQNNSGYGDGWGSPNGGTAGSFTFTDGEFSHNTSDGLDMLYNSDANALITIDRMYFEGNVGQAVKVGGAKAIIRNSGVVANCGFWDGVSSKGSAFSTCRAGGNAIVVGLGGDLVDIVNNSIVGEPDILIDVFGCNGGETLNIQNNIIVGTTQYGGGDTTAWAYFYDGCSAGTLVTSSTAKQNVIYNVQNGSPCSSQSNCLYQDPQFTSANFTTDVFDLRLQSSSPAIDHGLNSGTTVGQTTVPTVDINGDARPASDVDSGAYEYGASNDPVMEACSLPAGTVGVAYDQTISVTGGDTPYTACDETSGSLPAGSPAFASTAVSGGCQITGTPTSAGTSNFTERVTDSSAATDSEACVLVINAGAPTITTTDIADGTVGYPYSDQVSASGGTLPYTFSDVSGNLGSGACSGLSIAASGVVSGTPTVAGTCNFTARVTDDDSQTDDQALSFSIGSANLVMSVPQVQALATSVTARYGAQGLPYEANCTTTLQNSGGTEIDSDTSTEGPARRNVSFTGLTAATTYRLVFACEGATPPDVSPSVFTTLATPSGGDRTVPIVFGAPPAFLSGAARITVDYDDNEALSTPASVQNTSCGSGCTVNLTLPAGLYYYRHKWQTAADAVLATSSIQPLLVQ